MKNLLLCAILLFVLHIQAQVGVNTTSPNAMLDVEASSASSPSSTDGILVPRITSFPVTNPGANQNGMLVYNTTLKNFYYWDHVNTYWQPFVKRINDLADGKSDFDGTNDGSSVFLGINSGLADDQSDNRNVGIGYQSLRSITAGAGNVAVGHSSLYYSDSGICNIAVGSSTLFRNTSGAYNTAIGNRSLFFNTTGRNNTALGTNTLDSNTTGDYNTALGSTALDRNSTGNYNIGIGSSSLYKNTSGQFNVAIGSVTLSENTISSNNVALGYSAGFNSTGSNNLFLGYQSGYNETGSNKLHIETGGNSDPDVDNPLIYGEFDNDIVRVNGKLQVSNPTGTGYEFPSTDGSASQVLQTNGSGTVSWATISTADTKSLSKITLSADQSITNATWTKVDFNNEDFDLNDDYDNVTDRRFEPTKNGYYRLNAAFHTTTASLTGARGIYGLQIRVNNAAVAENTEFHHHTTNSAHDSPVGRSANTVVYLTTSDYVEVFVYRDGNGDSVDHNSKYTYFELEFIRD